ncbi:hypothetical protein [Marinithermus hydrothermalis]|uniref:Uncharacterized protein n=1 Tax=Marinithermus hydrothermalis (strain DSM 14884 / JCM 11576 / T1) TaxID=869210 RepID=F2NNE6_MARHT|nr:hypothetical protein [Marinithermus hydrothermalis]AEB10987.1 hypothetical protein Marky_0226 [Marinithermus hydrothermalis DSM 14884]
MDPYREYQDYVMAYRLRRALGLPRRPLLSLAGYAGLRLERNRLAARLVEGHGTPALLKRLDTLSELLHYGFWSNPEALEAFLHHLPPAAPPLLSSPEAFEQLLTPSERRRLLEPGLAGRYYLGWLRLPRAMDPGTFEAILEEQEGLGQRLGLFLDAFHPVYE